MTYHVALISYSRQPPVDPLAVMRIDGDHEEIFDPRQGWVRADPRYREWFLNARTSEAEAESLVVSIGPLPPLDEDRDPRNITRRALAIEGYGDSHPYFAVEAEGHPFDDPLTVVQENLAGEREVLSFTRDLVRRRSPVEGRRVSITKKDVERFKDVQARRVFGDTKVRHFAVVNHVTGSAAARPSPRKRPITCSPPGRRTRQESRAGTSCFSTTPANRCASRT